MKGADPGQIISGKFVATSSKSISLGDTPACDRASLPASIPMMAGSSSLFR